MRFRIRWYHRHDHDHKLRAAYIHVVTDAATSVLAIAALAGGWFYGWFYGWDWLAPGTGIVGAVLVALWAKKVIVQSGRVLLDREMDHPVVEEISEVIAALPADGNTQLTDLHVWPQAAC